MIHVEQDALRRAVGAKSLEAVLDVRTTGRRTAAEDRGGRDALANEITVQDSHGSNRSPIVLAVEDGQKKRQLLPDEAQRRESTSTSESPICTSTDMMLSLSALNSDSDIAWKRSVASTGFSTPAAAAVAASELLARGILSSRPRVLIPDG
eukprot:CAMPEP_0176097404 /NCGR_PEP_ID=MMETSP0120_2-20121206/48833_1 /TAXON_ID=160619 /ORGANISM="Kryptoperidinium foliaceum, Strain CCMP 1326" /LENGTH=150 /DNA_ID=CAMNT_0017431399 /DNA_START=292 /DNA_END=745 /DNA_ORIENTATION=+